ncbi:ABC transporter ATP-binding protein [Marinomonas mediterranea]|jgi:ABC-type multidrug transport system, ATPase and permease components|uniref:Xenobiotic-transporting ATPase n=1 Tax=Marinomonas mediterranea (strain ATCC 700492 / JCM 21426 / NBRC 103028 / MMB-1) TaxID=717774 RepID=F2JUV8_MARM1|nr:ABC transporter ATP-binding protein [Marinomonas mediterranea]ADZ90523.1 Xenobiotic-transporting ATPase [Marinomonas mediterranea MMB-1]WCN08576.1 ATP-binding cassette domain-containing protein [Marinomonas mediterranea]WCN12630.1 ATP-binding cassette domain-containing protein [Marinomonas mediterranea]WCN16702.1 ATP-binding cassette domain-containing protein [Marinomonas mediterranea MMB-1]
MDHKTRILISAFLKFFKFAPSSLTLVFLLMLVQGITSGVGLLLIIPLLQVIGLDVGGMQENVFSNALNNLFSLLNIELSLISVLAFYIAVVTIIASLRLALTVQSSQIQQAYITHLRQELYTLVLKSRWSFITQRKMSDFTHGLTAQVQSLGHSSFLILQLINQLTLTTVMVGLAFLMSWKLTMVAMGCAMCLLVSLRAINKQALQSGNQHLVSNKGIFQLITEQLASLKMIKSYSNEDYCIDKLGDLGHQLADQNLKIQRVNAITQWIYLVGAVIIFSILFYFSFEIFAIPISALLLLLIVFSRLLPQISNLQRTFQQLLHHVPSFADIKSITNDCLTHQESLCSSQELPIQLNKRIVVESVTYQYAGKTEAIIDDLSFTIPVNQTVALIGPSGVGKSTTADIISGLLIPNSGKVYIDDVALDSSSSQSWRQNIAYVTQEVYLFNESIKDNLSWSYRETITDQEIWKALQLAAADEFVRSLPDQLDTIVGDRGIRLSGGERQRLALARALLSKPQLLILDEATSALDYKNELKIQEALESLHGRLTVLIIAHRETTIKHADIKIDLGRAKAESTTFSHFS